ncbi:hypothetical protein ONZ45_g17318 [Pleurotus djamor]|nr:hypothetical protein ONZ45_g17318 [Pleurotus djamor]
MERSLATEGEGTVASPITIVEPPIELATEGKGTAASPITIVEPPNDHFDGQGTIVNLIFVDDNEATALITAVETPNVHFDCQGNVVDPIVVPVPGMSLDHRSYRI